LECWSIGGSKDRSVGVLEYWRTGGIRAVAGDKSQEAGIQELSTKPGLDARLKHRHLI
jgi:hypothetical protein